MIFASQYPLKNCWSWWCDICWGLYKTAFAVQSVSAAVNYFIIMLFCHTFDLLSKNCSFCSMDIRLGHFTIPIRSWWKTFSWTPYCLNTPPLRLNKMSPDIMLMIKTSYYSSMSLFVWSEVWRSQTEGKETAGCEMNLWSLFTRYRWSTELILRFHLLSLPHIRRPPAVRSHLTADTVEADLK